MASIVQKPENKILPAYSSMVFVATENAATIAAAAYYRYVFNVKIRSHYYTDTAVSYDDESIEFKVVPNKEKKGIVDISQVVKDYIETDERNFDTATQAIHNTTKYSRNIKNLVEVEVQIGYEFSAAALGAITSITPQTFAEYRVFNGCQQIEDGLTYDYTPHILDGGTKSVLSNLDSTVARKLRRTDYATVAFFNGVFINLDGTIKYSDANKTQIKFYDSDDAQIGVTQPFHTNTTANNGAPASSTTNGTLSGLLYLGVGAQNITDAGITIPANASYYTFQFMNITYSSARSKLYTFKLQDDDCKGYETIRLAYLNRVGAYDYFNFTKLSRKVTNIARDNYTKNVGTWQGDSYSYNTFERGRAVLNTTAIETIEAHTDYITEAEAEGLEELFTSPSVWVYDNSNKWLPVVVTEQSYTKQTTANDMLKQYVIAVEKAHNKRIQTS
tara:strand:+ start:462 stop:1796 length:1335 start_codon:yes stop_codon:yes gene_type:complete